MEDKHRLSSTFTVDREPPRRAVARGRVVDFAGVFSVPSVCSSAISSGPMGVQSGILVVLNVRIFGRTVYLPPPCGASKRCLRMSSLPVQSQSRQSLSFVART